VRPVSLVEAAAFSPPDLSLCLRKFLTETLANIRSTLPPLLSLLSPVLPSSPDSLPFHSHRVACCGGGHAQLQLINFERNRMECLQMMRAHDPSLSDDILSKVPPSL
jgi:hypothetical protein